MDLLPISQRTRKLLSLLAILLRWPLYMSALACGIWVLGPFFHLPLFVSALALIESNEILAALLNPLDWFLEPLAGGLALLAFVWAGAFFGYTYWRDELAKFNEFLGYTSILTGGVAKLLITMFWLFAGAAIYESRNTSPTAGLLLFALDSTTFGVPGLFYRYFTRPHVRQSAFLDKHAMKLAVIALSLSGLFFLYALTANFLPLLGILVRRWHIGA